MTGENKINKDVLCILIQNKESKQIEIRYMEIEKDLEVEFTNLEKIFEVKHYNANTIASYIMNHKTLSKLFNYYDYCKDLSKPWQGITSILETALSSYSSNFDSVKDPEKRKELVDKQKRELLLDCKERLIAMRLEKSYKKCQKEETIIAFSHRKVGWSTPKYALDDNFSVEIKTNFGYGNSSYFYSKLRYKELDIIPFTDWVSYRFANIFEIIQYSKKHYLMNESWLESMQFISEAYNLSLEDENRFIEKYIIGQCESMVLGLENLLINDTFKLKEYKLLDQEKGYVNLKFKGHNLVEFRGDKITGSLQFIEIIKGFSHVFNGGDFIKRIENCNQKIMPMLIEEMPIIKNEISVLDKDKKTLEQALKKQDLKHKAFEQKKTLLIRQMTKESKIITDAAVDARFSDENPGYKALIHEIEQNVIEYNQKISEINRLTTILENLVKYKKSIENYFRQKYTNIAILDNDFFILRLICVHFPFTKKDILKFHSILKWGSCDITRYEYDSYFQSASHAKYGLNFNKNIDWDKEIVSLNNFESNSYQWAGFDENAFPLSIEEEVFNCIKIFNEYSYDPEPEFHPGTDEITTKSSEKIAAHFEQIEKSMNYYLTSTTKIINFSTLEEFTDFTSNCGELYALNSNLYSNLVKLLHAEKFDIVRDVFEQILNKKA